MNAAIAHRLMCVRMAIASAILETYVKIVNFPPGRAHDGFPSYHEEKGHYDGKIRDILLGKFGITRISTMYRGTIFLIGTALTLTLTGERKEFRGT